MPTFLETLRESTIYYLPDPAPRVREQPLEVICPGLPRSGTESLSVALSKLGYTSYHGWDLLFENPPRLKGWTRLAQKKWQGPADGETNITAADFDALLGHATAITDTASSVFAADMIAAYPQAKVILNTRRDLDAWHQSVIREILGKGYESWIIWYTTIWSARGYWNWNAYFNYLAAGLFRAQNGNVSDAIRRNGKWLAREHEAMIRGLVPADRLLEWSPEDGWEKLCKFLDKPVPNEPFPRVNDASGFSARIQGYMDDVMSSVLRNHAIVLGMLVVGGSLIWNRSLLPGLFKVGS